MMSKVIRISDEIFNRLQGLAEPLVDTPASVIEKLLDEYKPATNKNYKMEKTNLKAPQNLFLAPADKSNIKQTIQKKVLFDDAEKFLNDSDIDVLKLILQNNDSFNCWAMSESNRPTFSKMRKGDYVLLSEKATGKFNYMGKVAGKLESTSLGNNLWSFTPGKPWNLIYILDDVRLVDINKKELVQTLGYSAKDVVQKVRRVQKQNLYLALKKYEDIDSMINELNNVKN
jgi:hypothetical protein